MEETWRAAAPEDAVAPLLLVEEVAYLVVLEAVIWGEVHVEEGPVGGQEEGLVEDQAGVPGEDQEAGDEASDPVFLRAYQEASGTEERLVGGLAVGQREVPGASWEELEAGRVVEALSLAGLAWVEVLAAPRPQQEGACADRP